MTDKPCGCKPGYCCPAALALWDEAEKLRDKFTETGNDDDRDACLAAKQKYDEHKHGDDSCGASRERS